MRLHDCIGRIEKYLASSDAAPRLVNVQSVADLSVIIQHFDVVGNTFLQISTYAKNDENVRIDELQSDLASKTGNLFVTGMTSYLKLLGEPVLSRELENLVSQTYAAHVIILCYQCEKHLCFNDSRVNRLIYSVAGECSKVPELIFVHPELSEVASQEIIDGIQNIAELLEQSDGGTLYVKTSKYKSDYPGSLLHISEQNNAFTALCSVDATTQSLDINYGTDEQWRCALREVVKVGSWGALISNTFRITTDLSLIAGNWKSFDETTRWLYFISLKLYGAGNNWCLSKAINLSDNMTVLVRNVYRSLLSEDHTNTDFWSNYNTRRALIETLGSSDEETFDYLQMVRSKEENAIYYLTDATKEEKELIIVQLSLYALQNSREETLKVLSHVYPDLYAYLQPYRFKNEQIGKYFQEYKYQKVINKILPEFLSAVEEHAKNREYNLWLGPRTEIINDLDKSGARLYFLDALGVEYLSFILEQCKRKDLMADIRVCCCELPSITSINKEFLAAFDDIAPDIKRLDNIKHHGEESFDYRTTKLPMHLIRELEIIEDVLSDIRKRLFSGSIDRAYIISDHGASRLAVINESECQWEMASNGQHSGRCCPFDEADVQSEYAAESNGFWVLANYDRFKGGRKACVEVHGGATLEEVTVPIIELTAITGEIEIGIHSPLPIEVSYKQKAEIQLFSKTKLAGVTACVRGINIRNFSERYYDAVSINPNIYTIFMPDVKKAGKYTIDVFSNDNPIKQGLEFTVKQKSGGERDIL